MSLSLYLNIFSKDWEIHGDGVAKEAKTNMSGWPFNLDFSEVPKIELFAFSVTGGGGAKVGTFTASSQDDRILLPSHGLVNGDQVRFVLHDPMSCALPTPLAETTNYFVVGVRGNDFQVSGTSGGPLINLTDKGIGSNEVWVGGSAEALEQLGCQMDGTFVTILFGTPIPLGASKIIRLKAKIGL